MSEGLEKLRSIGAQKIHERTHIAHKYVQAILYESFEGMQKVQLLGFISILEREYEVDLTPLRERALEYFKTAEPSFEQEEPSYKKELLVSSQSERKKMYLWVALVAIVIVGATVYFTSKEKDTSIKESNLTQKAAATSAGEDVDSEAQSSKSNVSTVALQKPEEVNATSQKMSKPVKKESHTLSIIPRTKVWLGIIDLQSGAKRQTVTSHSIELNASKRYLLTFGHGYIDIAVDGNKTSFKDPKSVKFIYEDGRLKKIDNAEFRGYNKGKLW